MKTLACYNIKGGVGKSSVAVNFAHLSALEGSRTLLWDLDQQGMASYCYRVTSKVDIGELLSGKSDARDLITKTTFENLDVLPADLSYQSFDSFLYDAMQPIECLINVLNPLQDDYDFIVLDCPPGFSILSEAVFHISDALLVPTKPSVLSLRTLKVLVAFRRKHNLDMKLIAFLSMVDRRRRMHKKIIEALPNIGPWMLPTIVPYASVIEQMAERRAPLTSFAPNSPAGIAYAALWDEVREIMA